MPRLPAQRERNNIKARRWSRLSATHYFDIMDISDAVMGIFDWQQL